MAETTTGGPIGEVETAADFGKDPAGIVTRWSAWLKLADKDVRRFEERGRDTVKRYMDERSATDTRVRYNVLWANVQTMAPAILIREPRCQVERRYRDRDPVGRLSADILERATSYEQERGDLQSVLFMCRDDRLLVGRGQGWIRYEPLKSDDGTVVEERVVPEHINWRDFRCSPARTWAEVDAVGRRAYMTREQLVKRFPKFGEKVPLTVELTNKDDLGDIADIFKKAEVWEVWNKPGNEVLWFCKDYHDSPLDRLSPPPLRFENFFPCPHPFNATITTDSVVPVSDFYEYQDQADELDNLTARIGKLQKAIRVKGVYPGENKDALQRLLGESSDDNSLEPVSDWAEFMLKGGLEKMVSWLPIEQITKALLALYEARKMTKQDLDEISGLADIIRGITAPSETAAAQTIKSRFASLRLQVAQADCQRFARDMLRLMAEVIADQFSAEMLSRMTGLPELPDRPEIEPPMQPGANAMADPAQIEQYMAARAQYDQVMAKWQAEVERKNQEFTKAVQLLKDDRLRGFRLDVETDSTIAPDEEAEKSARVEFLTAVGLFFEKVAPLVAQGYLPVEVAKSMLTYMARGFRAGRDLEQAFDKIDEIAQQPPQGPDPVEMAKAKAAEMAATNEAERIKVDAADKQGRLQLDTQKHAEDMQLRTQIATAEAVKADKTLEQGERQLSQKDQEIEIARRKAQDDASIREGEVAGRLLLDKHKIDQGDRHKDIDTETAEKARKDQQVKDGASPPADQPAWLGETLSSLPKLGERIEEIVQHTTALGERITGMEAEAGEPIVFIHGPDKKLAKVRKGSREIAIERKAS